LEEELKLGAGFWLLGTGSVFTSNQQQETSNK